jgi:hypothetical protein
VISPRFYSGKNDKSTEEKTADVEADKNNHTSTASKNNVEEQGRITLGEIAAIEKNLTNSKVDSLQTLHNVCENLLMPIPAKAYETRAFPNLTKKFQFFSNY